MIDIPSLPDRKILCVDMKSFYASVSAIRLGLDPLICYLVVVADTERSGSVVLAASPMMKKVFGIRTGSRLFEIPKDPKIHIVNAEMKTYLEASTAITKLFHEYVPRECIHTYSVDESFLCIDGTERLWGEDPVEVAWKIKHDIYARFGLPCAIGIGPNMLMAKLCLDLEAKGKGVERWTYSDVQAKLWKVSPLREMWGIGTRLEKKLNRMGIRTVGQLASYPLSVLEKKFGIMGNQLYYHAHGIDFSDLGAPIFEGQISFGKSQILMRDYPDPKEVKQVMLEMCEEVARRSRKYKKCGRTISLGIGYSQAVGGGFYRSKSIEQPTNITKVIYDVCLEVFEQHYNYEAVRKVSITLSNIYDDGEMQLSLFEPDQPKLRKLGYVMDEIRQKYGADALLRGVSYTKAGTTKQRSKLIGGHKS